GPRLPGGGGGDRGRPLRDPAPLAAHRRARFRLGPPDGGGQDGVGPRRRLPLPHAMLPRGPGDADDPRRGAARLGAGPPLGMAGGRARPRQGIGGAARRALSPAGALPAAAPRAVRGLLGRRRGGGAGDAGADAERALEGVPPARRVVRGAPPLPPQGGAARQARRRPPLRLALRHDDAPLRRAGGGTRLEPAARLWEAVGGVRGAALSCQLSAVSYQLSSREAGDAIHAAALDCFAALAVTAGEAFIESSWVVADRP